jgi:hypothetical protein
VALKSFSVRFGLPFGLGDVGGVWEPDENERDAAWKMYVELITRISVVELREGEGLLREALNSLYSLFGVTREILKEHGPTVAKPGGDGDVSFGALAVTILNSALRPFMARWHPALEEYEAGRPDGVSRRVWEDKWSDGPAMRAELEQVRTSLVGYAKALGEVCGAEDLIGVND